MLFTHKAVDIIVNYRDDSAICQHAVFERTGRDEEAPLVAVLDICDHGAVIHELNSRGYEERLIRVPFPQGRAAYVVARQLGWYTSDLVATRIFWDRLAWHPEVARLAA